MKLPRLKFPGLSIAARLYALFALLAATTVTLSVLAAVNARHHGALTAEFESANSGTWNVELINGLVYAVVMESRGVYMSPDVKKAKVYADGILKLNGKIAKIVDEWKKNVTEADQKSFETFSKRIAQFIQFRAELARLGTDVSPAAGREWGDNDANRSVRKALNGDLEKLREIYAARAKHISAQIAQVSATGAMQYTVLAAVAIGLTILGFCMIMFKIARPISRLQDSMMQLADGKLDIEVPGTSRTDEIGKMAKTVLVFRDAGKEKIRLERESEQQRHAADEERQKSATAEFNAARERAMAQEEAAEAKNRVSAEQARQAEERAAEQARIAEEQARMSKLLADALHKLAIGDLTYNLKGEFNESYQVIANDFNSAVAQLRDTIAVIATTAADIMNATRELSTSTTDLSQRTEEQAAGLEQTSASMEQISATVKHNAENASHANQLAATTRDVADRSGAVVEKAIGAMSRIEESSHKIGDIIGVIDEIARQTNLLALNAAVEAARAGDAGRGFAVVASEVRSLAQRSSQAAKDIKDLITNSNGQVKDGVDLVNRAGSALSEIVESIKKVAEVVGDIANASAEQAGGIDQVNKALTQMDEVTQQNSALVEENAATAKTLEQQSTAMNDEVNVFLIDESEEPVAQPAPKAKAA